MESHSEKSSGRDGTLATLASSREVHLARCCRTSRQPVLSPACSGGRSVCRCSRSSGLQRRRHRAQREGIAALTTLSQTGLASLARIVSGFPISDVMDILSGTATVDTDLDLAQQVVGLVAAAFPPGALVAGEVGLALEALQFLLDAAGQGSLPVTGGVPAAFPSGGGTSYRER